jgi:transposase InsO family protein
MAHVDALSRYPCGIAEINKVDITEGDWILAAQLQDDQLVRIRDILKANIRNNDTKQYFLEFQLKNDKIYRKLPDGKNLWLVPKTARWQILRLCHDKAGHPGIEYTMHRIQQNYWFAKMRRFVTKYVRACLNCSYYKNCTGKKQGRLHPIEKAAVQFHTLHVDHVGPFETSRTGNKFLFVVVDAFTKFTIIEAVRSQKAKVVIRALRSIMCIFGVPIRIVSDRGSAFTSRTFRIFCETYGIKHTLNAVATPRANGQCERYNQTIVNMLATSSVEAESDLWDTHVKELQSALNTSFNKGINTTPVQALFGYQARPIAEASLLNSLRNEMQRVDIQGLRDRIKDHITEDQRKQKPRYDKKRREATVFGKGELVLVLITSEKCTGTSRKLLPKFRGPFRVVRALYNDRYEVEDLREGRHKARTVVAVDKMKKWITIQM